MSRGGADAWTGHRYDQQSVPQHRWGTAVVRTLLAELPTASRILDAGCGSGRVTEEVLTGDASVAVVGVDASASMMEAARSRLAAYGDRFDGRVADLGRSLPFGAGTFDAVVSTGTLHWVPDHRALFAELARVLRPGGRLVAQAGGHGSLGRARELLRRHGVSTDGFNTYSTAEDAARVLAEAGFTSVATSLEPAPTPFASSREMRDFLDSAALGPYLGQLGDERREAVLDGVASGYPAPVLDFVRLNIDARVPSTSGSGRTASGAPT